MKRFLRVLTVGILSGAIYSVVLYAAASFPSSVHVFSTRSNGQTISASWFNDLQDEVVAIEVDIFSGFANTVKPLTDAATDLGTSAKQWRDLWLSRNLDMDGNAAIAGTLAVTSTSTLTGASTHTGAVTFSSGDNTFKVGASTETHKGAGIINTDSVQAATGANTTDTTLFTYSLPANALNADGRAARITAWGSFAANANTKTVRVKWNGIGGTTVIAVTVTSNNQQWVMQGNVIRTGSSTQDVFGTFIQSNSVASGAFTTSAATDTGAVTLSVTAQNGTANAGDIVYEGSIIEFLN